MNENIVSKLIKFFLILIMNNKRRKIEKINIIIPPEIIFKYIMKLDPILYINFMLTCKQYYILGKSDKKYYYHSLFIYNLPYLCYKLIQNYSEDIEFYTKKERICYNEHILWLLIDYYDTTVFKESFFENYDKFNKIIDIYEGSRKNMRDIKHNTDFIELTKWILLKEKHKEELLKDLMYEQIALKHKYNDIDKYIIDHLNASLQYPFES